MSAAPAGHAEVVVVTGGGGALGRAIVATMLEQGARVVAVDRDAGALSTAPAGAVVEAADLGDPDEVDALFARVAEAHGEPAAVLHAVGAYRGGDATASTAEDFLSMIDVNLHTAWWVSRAAGARMRRAGRGAIVLVAARQGVEVMPGAAAYSVSKAAVAHLARVLDAELREHGVRVNAVVPRLIDTPANRQAMPAGAMARAVAPEAIARVVAFLAGADAAPVVGALVPVYGAL
jgi:NAD(P)-dependent dehydrogenase (short-subunit alcohol dehydrogenase family)